MEPFDPKILKNFSLPSMERSKSPPRHLNRSRSPSYYQESYFIGEPPYNYLEGNGAPSQYFERSGFQPHNNGESRSDETQSHNIDNNAPSSFHLERNMPPSAFVGTNESVSSNIKNKSLAPTPKLRFEPPAHLLSGSQSSVAELRFEYPHSSDRNESLQYLEPEKHDYHYAGEQPNYSNAGHNVNSLNFASYEAPTGFMQFPNNSVDSGRNFGTFENFSQSLHSNGSQEAITPPRLFKSPIARRRKVESLEEVEKMTDEEILTFYLSGFSHRKVKLLIKQGMSSVEARRKIIIKNFVRSHSKGPKSNAASSRSGSPTESDAKLANEKTDANVKASSDSPTTDLTQHGSKRPISEDGNLENPEGKRPKYEKCLQRIAIVHADYPKVMLGTNKLQQLQNAVVREYNSFPKDSPPVRFRKSRSRGCLIVTCLDKTSAEWLRNVVPQMIPWPGAVLMMLNEDELLKTVKCTVFVPDDNGERLSAERILKKLRVSNRGLNAHLWTTVSNVPQDRGQLWTFAMDIESLGLMKKLNFKPHFGFGLLEFKLDFD